MTDVVVTGSGRCVTSIIKYLESEGHNVRLSADIAQKGYQALQILHANKRRKSKRKSKHWQSPCPS